MRLTRYHVAYPPYPPWPVFVYAEKDGSPVLRSEKKWHKICGVRWWYRGTTWVFSFRRLPW